MVFKRIFMILFALSNFYFTSAHCFCQTMLSCIHFFFNRPHNQSTDEGVSNELRRQESPTQLVGTQPGTSYPPDATVIQLSSDPEAAFNETVQTMATTKEIAQTAALKLSIDPISCAESSYSDDGST